MDLPSKTQEHEQNQNAGKRKSAKSKCLRCDTESEKQYFPPIDG